MISRMRIEIERADIMIADVTHNNPNVHFELGIALYLNKNILRVTGRNLTELGFDVRGLDTYQYNSEENLLKKIYGYLQTFLSIKDLPLSETAGPLYMRIDKKIELVARKPGLIAWHPLPFRMRDGAASAVVTFREWEDPSDWFGFYFRFEDDPIRSSYLVYVRQNGFVEIASYPGTVIIAKEQLVPEGVNCEKTFRVELDGDTAIASIDGRSLICHKLNIQYQGNVWMAAHRNGVECRTVELVCRDTINA